MHVYHPDIVFGSESQLKPNILSCEMFPSGYTVYRKDRHDGYGAIFIACCNTLIPSKLQLDETSSELVVCQIQLADHSFLIACLIYPSGSDSHLTTVGTFPKNRTDSYIASYLLLANLMIRNFPLCSDGVQTICKISAAQYFDTYVYIVMCDEVLPYSMALLGSRLQSRFSITLIHTVVMKMAGSYSKYIMIDHT